MSKTEFYPKFEVPYIKKPNRFFAFPILGLLVKFIICIPQFFILIYLWLAWILIGGIINPFIVLFTGKYWNTAYNVGMSVMHVSMKVNLYFFGLTDKYPGFSICPSSAFVLEMKKPENPNRLFAVPLFGGLIRSVLLIPYYIYYGVITAAAQLGATGGSLVVLFQRNYPESIYELARDANRLTLAASCYSLGLSDSYPSFWISMKHKNIKIALITLVVLYYTLNYGFGIVGAILAPKESKYESPYQQKDTDYKYEENIQITPEEYTPPAT